MNSPSYTQIVPLLLLVASTTIYQHSIASDDQQTADPIQAMSINQEQPAQKQHHGILTFSQQQELDQSLESSDSLLIDSDSDRANKKQTKKIINKKNPVKSEDNLNTIDPIITDF